MPSAIFQVLTLLLQFEQPEQQLPARQDVLDVWTAWFERLLGYPLRVQAVLDR